MEDNKGFVKLYRSMLNWEWYDDVNTKVLFLHLILTVNYEDKKWHGKPIKRGQRVVSVQRLSNELRLSAQQVRTAINKLISTNELTNSKFDKSNVLTLVNYDKYQSITTNQQGNQQSNNNVSTNYQQIDNKVSTTTKELKEYKEVKKGTTAEKNSSPIPYKLIQDLYNQICVSYPKCTTLSEARKKAIKARINNGYAIEDFKTLFIKAEASEFLKGKNNRNWSANMDWLIKDANMAKVLDGNYDSKDSSSKDQQSYDIDDLDSLAVNLR